MLNRFLGALKSQLERKWSETREIAHAKEEEHKKQSIRGHARQWSRALRQQQETEPLSPTTKPLDAEKGESPGLTPRTRGFWVANAPWDLKRDGISAMLEFVRALIAYILYGAMPFFL